MTSGTYIDLILIPTKNKTLHWRINSKGGAYLGAIMFYPAWRKYCFYPAPNCLFEQVCLREIAAFVESQTALWRKEVKARK